MRATRIYVKSAASAQAFESKLPDNANPSDFFIKVVCEGTNVIAATGKYGWYHNINCTNLVEKSKEKGLHKLNK